MTNVLPKAAALGGLCALLLGATGGAIAQGYHHDWHHPHHAVRARRHLKVLHAVYAHEIKSGHPEAAMRAHMKAKAIRAHIRNHHH